MRFIIMNVMIKKRIGHFSKKIGSAGRGRKFLSTTSSAQQETVGYPSSISFTNNSNGTKEDHSNTSNIHSDSNLTVLKSKILDLAITKVFEYGWTDQALIAAAIQMGYSINIRSLFQSSYSSSSSALISHYHTSLNRQTLVHLQSISLNDMSVKEKLFTAIKYRLQLQIPMLSILPISIGNSILPQHMYSTTVNIAEFIDDIWFIVGDQSTDVRLRY